jgi:predicted CxxxxCH...CXXCH cytochrome family protein
MFRHDPRHTGHTPYTGPATPILYWAFQANDGIASSPTIGHNGTIYVGAGGYYGGGKDSSLYAINPDGTLKWQFKTGNTGPPRNYAGIFSSPAVANDGTIYVGSHDGHCYAIDDSVTYGKLRWRAYLENWPGYSSPVIGPDGRIYVGGLSFYVYSFNPDGSVAWSYMTDWCVFSSPAIGPNGLIYVGSKDHHLYCFDPATVDGAPEWSYAAGQFYDGHLIDCSPAIGPDGTVYFGTDPFGAAGQLPVPVDTSFFALNPDGSLKWRMALGGTVGIESSPAIGPDGTIYVGSYDSCLYAIEDAGTEGVIRWAFKSGGLVDASPTVDGEGTIYIGSNDSIMYALDPEDGSVRWSFATDGKIESSATIDGQGYLYFGSFDGKLYALGSGAPDVAVISAEPPGSFQSGTVYVPAATFVNYRAGGQAFDAQCRIVQTSQVLYDETLSGVVLGDAEMRTLQFPFWTVSGVGGEPYQIEFEAVLLSDDNSDNNVLSLSAGSCCVGRVGDANGQGGDEPTLSDISVLIDLLYISGDFLIVPCPAEADVNKSGGSEPTYADVTISDISMLIDYLFITGPSVGLADCEVLSASCVNCHGGVDNQAGAPPRGLEGELSYTAVGVGAHTRHVGGGNLSTPLACRECHVVPADAGSPGHIDGDHVAEVTFGSRAGNDAAWDRVTETCGLVYCHGNFAHGNPMNTPQWTATGQASCGTCHDVGANPALLGGRHEKHARSYLGCYECHASVVDNQLTIVDRSLHVNGERDVKFAYAVGTWGGGWCTNPACHASAPWY